jgi:hypothetical protein
MSSWIKITPSPVYWATAEPMIALGQAALRVPRLALPFALIFLRRRLNRAVGFELTLIVCKAWGSLGLYIDFRAMTRSTSG